MDFNFIDHFVEYTNDAESPTDFFIWAALSALSAVARDNIKIETSVVTIYPNIYVLLYARSGACKKSVPLKKILPIIKEVKNTTVIEGRTSMQWAISKLARGFTGTDGEVITGASGLLFSEELSSFVIKDDNTIDYLTDLYDFHASWDSGTHARGEEKLERVCLSILAATNEHMFKQVFTSQAVYGGLLSRTFIVAASRARKKNSLMLPSQNKLSEKPLVEHLFRVSRLRGHITIEPEAAEFFDTWYNQQDFDKHDSETGMEWRLSTHILKIAMLLSLADPKLDKIITMKHMKRAMALVLALVPNYRMLSTSIVDSAESKQSVIIMMALLKLNGKWMTKGDLVRQHWFELDLKMIDEIVEKLIMGAMVERTYNADNDPAYRVTEIAINKYLNKESD